MRAQAKPATERHGVREVVERELTRGATEFAIARVTMTSRCFRAGVAGRYVGARPVRGSTPRWVYTCATRL
jgi:hypothetical protein